MQDLGSATQRTNAAAIGYRVMVGADNAMVLGGTERIPAVKVGNRTTIPTAKIAHCRQFNSMQGIDLENPSLPLKNFASTITKPKVDFAAIEREIGAKVGFIIGYAERSSPEERTRALSILERFEAQAAIESELNEGVVGDAGIFSPKKLKRPF